MTTEELDELDRLLTDESIPPPAVAAAAIAALPGLLLDVRSARLALTVMREHRDIRDMTPVNALLDDLRDLEAVGRRRAASYGDEDPDDTLVISVAEMHAVIEDHTTEKGN